MNTSTHPIEHQEVMAQLDGELPQDRAAAVAAPGRLRRMPATRSGPRQSFATPARLAGGACRSRARSS